MATMTINDLAAMLKTPYAVCVAAESGWGMSDYHPCRTLTEARNYRATQESQGRACWIECNGKPVE